MTEEYIASVRTFCHDLRQKEDPADLYVRWVEEEGKLPTEETAGEFVSKTLPTTDSADLENEGAPLWYTFRPELLARNIAAGGRGSFSDEGSRWVIVMDGETFRVEKKAPFSFEWVGPGITTCLDRRTSADRLESWMADAVHVRREAVAFFNKANARVIERAVRRRQIEQTCLDILRGTLDRSTMAYGVVADPDGASLRIGEEHVFACSLRVRYGVAYAGEVQAFADAVLRYWDAWMQDGIADDYTLQTMAEIPGDVSLLMEDADDLCFRIARRRFCEVFPPKFLRSIDLYGDRLVMRTRAGQFVVLYHNFVRNLDKALGNMGHYMRRPLRKRYGI